MGKFKEFKWNEWNHEYLGWLGLIISIFWFNPWLFWISVILTVDGIIQLFVGQYSGLLHWLYVNTLYKMEWVKKFNVWLDNLFGKKFN